MSSDASTEPTKLTVVPNMPKGADHIAQQPIAELVR